jgi:hypothetical protein
MMSGSLGLFRCEHRDLILTRSAYDHKRMRPLKPMVGVVKSLGYYRRGPVALIHKEKAGIQSKKPTAGSQHFRSGTASIGSLWWMNENPYLLHEQSIC